MNAPSKPFDPTALPRVRKSGITWQEARLHDRIRGLREWAWAGVKVVLLGGALVLLGMVLIMGISSENILGILLGMFGIAIWFIGLLMAGFGVFIASLCILLYVLAVLTRCVRFGLITLIAMVFVTGGCIGLWVNNLDLFLYPLILLLLVYLAVVALVFDPTLNDGKTL